MDHAGICRLASRAEIVERSALVCMAGVHSSAEPQGRGQWKPWAFNRLNVLGSWTDCRGSLTFAYQRLSL